MTGIRRALKNEINLVCDKQWFLRLLVGAKYPARSRSQRDIHINLENNCFKDPGTGAVLI